jgi:hypothetical protein
VDSDQELVLFVAWARDVAGDTQGRLAVHLYGAKAPADPREIRAIERATRDGRQRFRELGVLPWAAFDGVPPRRWWEDAAFIAAIRQWQIQAVTCPSDEPQPDPHYEMMQWIRNTARLDAVLDTPIMREVARRANAALSAALSARMPDPDAFRDRALVDRGITPWSPPGG